MSVECIVQSEIGLDLAVDALLQFAEGRRKIALSGNLGAGKTAFVKAFCRRLKVKENVTSPTYALVNQYVFFGRNGQEQLIHHLDLYRLRSLGEALDIGIKEYLDDEHYCLIEWPHIIEPIMPDDVLKISIELIEDSMRKIVVL